jgi:hypothetical protein
MAGGGHESCIHQFLSTEICKSSNRSMHRDLFIFLSSQESQFQVPITEPFVGTQGQTQGSALQQRTNKTLTIGPFDNTCEVDEVSPEVEVGVVVGIQCLQP